jgi:hypothetical protein
MRSRIILVILFFAMVSACREQTHDRDNSQSLPRIQINEVLLSYDDCHIDSASCTYVYVEYPEFSDTSKTMLNQIISGKLRDVAGDYFGDESQDGTFEHLAHSFVKDYQDFIIDFPGYQIGWYVKMLAGITYESEQVLSFSINSESYTGGAHPNYSTVFYVIDKRSYRQLTTADIIADTSQFKKQLEAEFRRIKGMSGEQSFAERGFYINDGDFLLNNNIGISDDKVLVHFNPYEIASYSEGATTIEMNKSDLKELLKIK